MLEGLTLAIFGPDCGAVAQAARSNTAAAELSERKGTKVGSRIGIGHSLYWMIVATAS
jgi:hypothetical protein